MKCPIVVLTKGDDHSLESQKVIDHANSSDRKWLTSHEFWSMRNGRMVMLIPILERDIASYPTLTPLTADSF